MIFGRILRPSRPILLAIAAKCRFRVEEHLAEISCNYRRKNSNNPENLKKWGVRRARFRFSDGYRVRDGRFCSRLRQNASFVSRNIWRKFPQFLAKKFQPSGKSEKWGVRRWRLYLGKISRFFRRCIVHSI